MDGKDLARSCKWHCFLFFIFVASTNFWVGQSYVLHQEKNVLFQTPKSPPKTEGLSRSLTKRPGAPQPLVNVNSGNVFEPGSLLHRWYFLSYLLFFLVCFDSIIIMCFIVGCTFPLFFSFLPKTFLSICFTIIAFSPIILYIPIALYTWIFVVILNSVNAKIEHIK